LRARLFRRGVTVPAAALTTVLAPAGATAALPPQLVPALVRSAAALVTTGKLTTALVSPPVATLMRGVLMKMFLSRLFTTTALTAVLALTLGSAAATWHLTRSTQTPRSAPGALAEKGSHTAAARPLPAGFEAGKRNPGKPALRLPTDQNAVVLQMSRSVDSATGPTMILTIHADGRVNAEIPDGLASLAAADLTKHAKDRAIVTDPDRNREPSKTKVITGRLSPQELEELLRFALHDQEFFDFDQAAVKAAIQDRYRSDGNVADSTDATTTCFRIQTADRKHEVKWTRLAKAAWDFPNVERLLQLHALDMRLQQVFYVLLAGGPDRVEAAVQKVNELAQPFYSRYPEIPQLTAADLLGVTPSADGTGMVWTFSRNKDNKVRNPLFEVSINVSQQGEPTLRYVIPPQENTLRESGGVRK
jgi:hypothetical protein